MDALHVIAGALLQLAGVSLWRKGLSDVRPWLLTTGLTLLNEAHDLWFEQWPHPGMQLGQGFKDIAITLLLPSLLLGLARWKPEILLPNSTASAEHV